MPGGASAIVRWKPFSLTAFRILRALAAHGVAPRTILDCGANIGQFARAAVETFPDVRVVAFEPVPEIARTLERNLADRPRVEVRHVALGSYDGTTSFHRNEFSSASSILTLRRDAQLLFPGVRERDVIEVPIARLDTALADESLEQPVLLKLDLQGYELEAVKGARRTLAQTQHVLLETSFAATYEGEHLFGDVYAAMWEVGFRLVAPVAVLRDARGRVAQMDALFEARPER